LNPYTEAEKAFWLKRSANLFFFEKAVMRKGWKDKYHNFGAIHKEMCDHLTEEEQFLIFLSAYRGSFKTTVLEGFLTWNFCWSVQNDIADSIIYMTAIEDNAVKLRDAVKHDLLANPAIPYIFDRLPKTEREYQNRGKMTKNRIQCGEVVMEFWSMENTLVSQHFPKWINDDIENDKNTLTESGREKLKSKWKYQKAISTKLPGRDMPLEIETGTPYHFDGIIWEISKNDRYSKLMIPAWTEVEVNGKVEKKLAFPEFHSMEYFENKRSQMDKSIFAAQYLLQPIDEEDALCKSSWIKYWDGPKGKGLPTQCYRTLVIDPGGAEPGQHDATGITVVDTDQAGDMYIVHAEEYFLTPNALMDMIQWLKNTFHPDEMRIEKDRFMITIADIFKHRYPLLNIRYVTHQNRRKPARIMQLRQWFESGRVYLKQGMEQMENQLLRYKGEGSIKRDDLLDSLSYHLDIRKLPAIKQPHRLPSGKVFEPKTQADFDEEIAKLLASRDAILQDEQRYFDDYY